VSLLGTLKGLPSGYNKDLQDDKRALFDAVDTMLLVLPAVAGTVGELTFDTARMSAALSSTMMATDLADYLVRRARPSARRTARWARWCARRRSGRRADALPLARSAAHPLFGDDVRDALSARASVARREAVGGTGPNAVREQLAAARLALQPVYETPARRNELVTGDDGQHLRLRERLVERLGDLVVAATEPG
jgi:argininosuccinate lyase